MFFDRPETGEVTILVHVTIESDKDRTDPVEFEELALSAGAVPVGYVTGTRKKPSPNYFVSAGKLEEIATAVRAHKAQLVLFNHSLTPSQERNLEKVFQCRVLDRTGLILDIFAQRARSHEGKLQVELAQLKHLSSRLKRGWTHLDRQKGGIGLRGAGEKQLELDQRMIGQRIKTIRKSLSRVRSQREQGRRSRSRAEIQTISLVGYTNAGKSTLFNSLTNAGSYAADKLFATLDSTLRRVELPNFGSAIMVDTVGFISRLPHHLVEAFRATLEETASADLLLHIIDCAHEYHSDYIEEVDAILAEIGAGHIRQLRIFNKIDLVDGVDPRIDYDENGLPVRVWISAQKGLGINLLLKAMGEALLGTLVVKTVRIAPEQTRLRSHLYKKGFIEAERIDEGGFYHLRIRLPENELEQVVKQGAVIVQTPELADPAKQVWIEKERARTA